VITTAMATVVTAPRDRVWRTLTDPAEIVRWDETRRALVAPSRAYPVVASKVRWRSTLGGVGQVLHETPQVVEAPHRIAVSCHIGSLHFDQLFALQDEPEDPAQPARTRVSLKLATRNQVHLIGGGDVDRFEVRRMLIERIDATLRALQKRCENAPESSD